MKSVLMSIQPKWCELIASGKKTVEIRKTRPKLEPPFKVYIYCTKDKNHSFCTDDGNQYTHIGNGKVIGEFVCNGLTYIEAGYDTNGDKHLYNTAFIEHRMCISDNELHKYLYKDKNRCGGWAWHISDLIIYEKPRKWCDFYKSGAESMDELLVREELCSYCSDTNHGELKCYGAPSGPIMCEGRFCDSAYREYLDDNFALARPPQSWCYVQEVKQ